MLDLGFRTWLSIKASGEPQADPNSHKVLHTTRLLRCSYCLNGCSSFWTSNTPGENRRRTGIRQRRPEVKSRPSNVRVGGYPGLGLTGVESFPICRWFPGHASVRMKSL